MVVLISIFISRPQMDFSDILSYWGIISHIMGHTDWNHFFNNFSFILLLGPILEQKYGSHTIIWAMLVTSIVTGVLNFLFFFTSYYWG